MDEEHKAEVLDLIAFKREKKAKEQTWECEHCGKPKIICRAYGRACVYTEEY